MITSKASSACQRSSGPGTITERSSVVTMIAQPAPTA